MARGKKTKEPRDKNKPGLPVNLIAEKSLLGALLRGADGYFQICDSVSADCFSLEIHQKIYAAIADACQTYGQISIPVLASKLPTEDEEGKPVESYLYVMMDQAIENNHHPGEFAETVAEIAQRRRLIVLSEKMIERARDPDLTRQAIDIASEAELTLLDIMRVSSPQRPKKITDVAEQVMKAASDAFQSEVLPGFTTGLKGLDEILGLILGGDLGFIIASQGDGKSTLAAQIGMHIAKNRPVFMSQHELSDEQVAARELAALSGVSVGKIQEGAFDQFQYEQIRDAQDQLRASQFWILDTPDITVRQLKSHILAMKRSVGLGAVLVDQLDKVRASMRYTDRFERMAEITRDLKSLAKETKVPIIALAQRTRGAQRRDDPTPDILDADAPSIERDADWVIGLWQRASWLRRNRPSDPDEVAKWKLEIEECSDQAEVICLKRRRGKAFEQRKLRWIGAITRFEDI